MSVNLEQTEGTGGGATEPPPHPCKPKDASSATAGAAPSLSSSRRVKFCIDLIIRCALRSKGRTGHHVPVCRTTGNGLIIGQNLGLQDGAALENWLARLGFDGSHFAEEMQVRGHHDSGAEMRCRREVNPVGEIVGEETHGDLTLAVRVLVNRSGDDSFLKVRSHLGK